MGKTLKRQRQKQLREQQLNQQQHQQPPAKLPRLADGKPLTAASSSSKFTAAVSAALQKGAWLDAMRVLEAMQEHGKVPKLGAVQRWVRDADQVGWSMWLRLPCLCLCPCVPRYVASARSQQQNGASKQLQGTQTLVLACLPVHMSASS